MSTYITRMKTHKREEITYKYFGKLNLCMVHNHTPKIFIMVVGKMKEVYYVINCDHDDCGKIGSTPNEVINAWNKWNTKL